MSNKNYIGKGKAQNFGVKVTIQMNKAQQFIFEREGERYLTFFLNEMQEQDKFGRTHTAFVLKKEDTDNILQQIEETPAVAEPLKEIKRKRSTKKN